MNLEPPTHLIDYFMHFGDFLLGMNRLKRRGVYLNQASTSWSFLMAPDNGRGPRPLVRWWNHKMVNQVTSEALFGESSWFIMVFDLCVSNSIRPFGLGLPPIISSPVSVVFSLFGWFLHHFGVNFLLGKSAIRCLCYTTFVNAASQDHHWCNWAALGHIGRKIHRRVIQNAYLEQVQKQTCKMSTGYTVEVSLLHLCSSVWDFNWLSSFRLQKKPFFNMT